MLRRVMMAGAYSAQSILDFFAAGERGLWIDPADLASMSQDVDGLVPVTAVDQPVGRILDKSPNGHVFASPGAGRHPTLKEVAGVRCLDFNAALQQFLRGTADISLAPQTSSYAIVAAIEVDSVANTPQIFTRSYAAGAVGRYWFDISPSQQLQATVQPSGVNTVTAAGPIGGLTKRVVTMAVHRESDRSGTITVRVNGIPTGFQSLAANSLGNATPSIYARIGAYGNSGDTGETDNYLDGRIFGLVVRFTPSIVLPELQAMESIMASKVGL